MKRGHDLKGLMKDLLKYPATVTYRDDDIIVLLPSTDESLLYFGVGLWSSISRKGYDIHVVLPRNGRPFDIAVPTEDYARFETQGCDIFEAVKKYPSLCKAFEEVAKERAYLPLIENQTDKDIHRALTDSHSNVRFVKNLTHKRKKEILSRWVDCFMYMEQTKELCEFMVKVHGGAPLRTIRSEFKTDKLCAEAVRSWPGAIHYVPRQTEALKLLAVARDGSILSDIKNPSFDVMCVAVNQSPVAWDSIKDPKLRRKIKKAHSQKKYRCSNYM